MAEIRPIVMPKWGLAMQEGMLAAWHVAEGDRIEKGQDIADIETSKIANVFESPVGGLLRRRVAREGETLPVGALLAVVADEAVPDAEIDAFVEDFRARFAAALEAGGEAGPEPRLVEAGDWHIRVLEAGPEDAPVLVFLHGYGGDLTGWGLVQSPLSDAFRTVALDLPGHGGSTKTVRSGEVAELAEAVAATLDALGIAAAHLVGHSLGGAVAVEVTRRDPARVPELTLIAPAGLGPEIETAYIEGFQREKRAKKLRPVLEMLVHDPSVIGREMVEEVLKYKRLDGVADALAKIAEANFGGGRQRLDLRPAIGRLDMPVHVIWGQEDRILPPAHAEGLPPTVRVTLLEACGHLPQVERADEVVRLLRERAI
jgi:pyruvate dehydrogenase E2 component (dihydrolipoamide acetyltransferase)